MLYNCFSYLFIESIRIYEPVVDGDTRGTLHHVVIKTVHVQHFTGILHTHFHDNRANLLLTEVHNHVILYSG